MMRTLFGDAGWQTERVLEGMDASDDFYMQDVAQVKIRTWSAFAGHVTLLGDAGYCPSPISGMGTTLAVVGAYVLAGEIITALRSDKVDLKGAVQKYEEKMRPVAEKAQAIFPGAPGIANPVSGWGIQVLMTVMGIISWITASWVSSAFGWLGSWFAGKESTDGWDARLDLYDLEGTERVGKKMHL